MDQGRWRRPRALLALSAFAVSGCLPAPAPPPPPYLQFEVEPGGVYGPTIAPPIAIRLGQSVQPTHGPIGPTDGALGPPAFWEGHALSLDPDRERKRSIFIYVEGDDLKQISFQVNDQPAFVEKDPGAYVSGEFSMVRWAQDYSLRVTAENGEGISRTAAIYVQGEDARVEGTVAEPLRMRMLRQGESLERNFRGVGYQGKLYRHYWPKCNEGCDLTTPGGALIAMISGPTDVLLLLMDQVNPFVAFGLSYNPSPNYMIVAIPVRGESQVEIAALTRGGDIATGRWEKPGAPSPEVARAPTDEAQG